MNTLDDSMCEVLAAQGNCSTNYNFMIANCRQSCTRCKAFDYGRPKCVNANFNDSVCNAWATAGECTKNPVFMMTNCYMACTQCFRPYRTGNSALPGQVSPDTNGVSVVLPFTFTASSVITQYAANFGNLNPVHLQVWRPNGTNNFTLIFDEIYVPKAINQSEAIIMQWCVVVNAGDRLGFTSMSGASPVTYQAVDGDYSQVGFRRASLTGPFNVVNAGLEFSFSTNFFYGTNCN